MKIDFWRALGLVAGATLVTQALSLFIYNPNASTQAGDVVFSFVQLITVGIFSYLYFKGGSTSASAKNGLAVGIVFLAYPFLTGFISEVFRAMYELPYPLPPVTPWIMWASLFMVLVIPSLVGWYMAKNR